MSSTSPSPLRAFFTAADEAWMKGLLARNGLRGPSQKRLWFPVRGTPEILSRRYTPHESYEFAERVVDGRYEVGPVTFHSARPGDVGRRQTLYAAALKEMLFRARRASPTGDMTVRFVGDPDGPEEVPEFRPGVPLPLRDLIRTVTDGRDVGDDGRTLPDAVARAAFLGLSRPVLDLLENTGAVEPIDPLHAALASHARWMSSAAFRYVLTHAPRPGRVLGRLKTGTPLPVVPPEPDFSVDISDVEGGEALVMAGMIDELVENLTPDDDTAGLPLFEWTGPMRARVTLRAEAEIDLWVPVTPGTPAGRQAVRRKLLGPRLPFDVVFMPYLVDDFARDFTKVLGTIPTPSAEAPARLTVVFVPGDFMGCLPEATNLTTVTSSGGPKRVFVAQADRPMAAPHVLRGKINQHPL